MADKESLAAKGYAPGYTASEWPYRLPADKIYYSRQIFPCTYYYDPDNAVIPIALNLNIYGTQRLPTIKDDNEFCKYILDFAESLKNPGKEKIFSYLLAQDDGLRSELLAEYIRHSDPSPDLFDLFLSFYTITDYGAGAYDAALLQKLFSGRSDEQIQTVSAALSDFPEIISIYRGEAEGSTPYHSASSWSTDINAAIFFACRHGDKGHARIIRAKVRKKDIMASILDSNEKEVIDLPGMPSEINVERLIVPNSLLVMPPMYLDEYVKGREKIRKLYKRHNKGADGEHGASSRRIYKSSRKNCDTVTAFLIEYHCIDDEQAETYLQHSPIKGKSRAWLLYQIMKDADALDRVRFGIFALDVNFLRLSISHKLVPLAMAGVHQIKM